MSRSHRTTWKGKVLCVLALCGATSCVDGVDATGCPKRVDDTDWLSAQSVEELNALEGITDAHNILLLGSEIDDLSALHCLRRVNILSISTTSLEDLTGLENLRELGELAVTNNPSLVSLDGLENLEQIDEIALGSNEQISDLSALSHIETTGLVNIQMNPALTSLDDLAALRRISNSRLQVAGNTSLKTISGMTNLEYVQDGIVVIGNPALEPCDDVVLAAHVESPVPHDLQSDPAACD